MTTSALVTASSPFDLIAGLPVHPLVVHFAVVILPIAALALIVLVFVPKWRNTFGWLTLAGLFVGTGAAFVAKESGEKLAARVGLPKQHADLGDLLPMLAMLLFLVALTWFLVDRKARARGAKSTLATVLGIVGVILAIAATALTVAVGHTGATAAWSGKVAAVSSPATVSSNGSSAVNASGVYTLADVQTHNSPSDCWTVISGNVYNVTDWINQHPGGSGPIESLCGTDGTQAFLGQHNGQGRPEHELAQFQVGTLATSTGTSTTTTGASPTSTSSPAKLGPTASGYTMKDVRKHNSPNDCWTAINGNVYNVTQWITQHPGGSGPIESLCGTDGSQAFNGQHQGQGRPEQELSQFLMGPLSSANGLGASDATVTVTPAAFHTAPTKAYSAKKVAKHNSASSCWTIISGNVYDVTSWINRHPGGSSRILGLCGHDGTAAFLGQHGGQSNPTSILATFQIGTLKATSTAA